jgi:predicted nucleic acid-binding Zn ribbon protein
MSKPTVTSVKGQIDTHEAVCAERWRETITRIKRLEMAVFGTFAGVAVMLLEVFVNIV